MKQIRPTYTLFEVHLRELGLTFQREYRFCKDRKWRFDYILSEAMKHGLSIAIEIQGGHWINGRHNRGKGFESDCEKFRRAAMAGFLILPFTTQDILTGRAKEFLRLHLKGAIQHG